MKTCETLNLLGIIIKELRKTSTYCLYCFAPLISRDLKES